MPRPRHAFECFSDEMDLGALVIRNNTAFRHGGALRGNEINGKVSIRGVLVEGNRALAGGGIAFLQTVNAVITSDSEGQPTIIRGNIAGIGGGLYYEPGPAFLIVFRVGALSLSVSYLYAHASVCRW